jgi:hypothetical protein
MDTITLVEIQIDDGQQLIDRMPREGNTVSAAFWAKPADEDHWTLYIVMKSVDQEGTSAAYREILRVLRTLGNSSITSSDVKAIGEKQPIAQDVIELMKLFRGRGPVRLRDRLLGETPMDEVYLYTMGEVNVSIHGLTYPGDPTGAVHLTFEKPILNSKLVVNGKEYSAKVIDWEIAAPAGSKVESNGSGRQVLKWYFRDKCVESDANQALSLASLELHGFRIIQGQKIGGGGANESKNGCAAESLR